MIILLQLEINFIKREKSIHINKTMEKLNNYASIVVISKMRRGNGRLVESAVLNEIMIFI